MSDGRNSRAPENVVPGDVPMAQAEDNEEELVDYEELESGQIPPGSAVGNPEAGNGDDDSSFKDAQLAEAQQRIAVLERTERIQTAEQKRTVTSLVGAVATLEAKVASLQAQNEELQGTQLNVPTTLGGKLSVNKPLMFSNTEIQFV